jgi:hypothetical protein
LLIAKKWMGNMKLQQSNQDRLGILFLASDWDILTQKKSYQQLAESKSIPLPLENLTNDVDTRIYFQHQGQIIT